MVCSRLRDARGPVSSTTRPASIDVLHRRDDELHVEPLDRGVAELDDLGEVVAGVDVHHRERQRAGQNAFVATCSITTLSLPPENSSTGRSNSAATSRRRWIDSDSSASTE